MGRPASIIVANMRVKMTMSVVLTPVPRLRESALGCFFTITGDRSWSLSLFWTASSFSASITPFLVSPVRVFAS